MKLGLLCITQGLFISSTLLGNISSIENNFTYSFIALNQDTTFEANQDTTFEDSISIVSKSSIPRAKFKSPLNSMLYSAVLPGLGQAYMGKWKRGLIYLALDGIAAGVWYQNNIRAEERKKEYESYAGEYWDFARWIKDYYKWEPSTPPSSFDGNNNDWNYIREGFVNNTDGSCADPPHCYIDIWDHSHSIKFKWKNKTINTNSKDIFIDKFNILCGGSSPSPNNCINDIDKINNIISDSSVHEIRDHHFYEGIQKYDMFFAGWDDNDNLKVIDGGNNDENITSPHESAYQDIWSDYNHIKKLAKRGGSFMLINRFVSMIDGLFLAKKWNAENEVSLNLDVYPDLRNQSGVGRLKLTMGWK